jgi:hypothetical protein
MDLSRKKLERFVDQQNSNERERSFHLVPMAGFGCKQGSE